MIRLLKRLKIFNGPGLAFNGDRQTDLPTFTVNSAILHCCCSVTPEAFDKLMAASTLPFRVWYRALWAIQHDPDITNRQLEEKLGVSFPTAMKMRRKIADLLTGSH